jgi:hypothetical protein
MSKNKLPKQKPGVFDVSALKPYDRVVVDEFMGVAPASYDLVAQIMENPVHDPVLQGVPHQRQVLVKFAGSRRSVVIDAITIARMYE